MVQEASSTGQPANRERVIFIEGPTDIHARAYGDTHGGAARRRERELDHAQRKSLCVPPCGGRSVEWSDDCQRPGAAAFRIHNSTSRPPIGRNSRISPTCPPSTLAWKALVPSIRFAIHV